jgi:D-proline reductase (dithiol) PrdB
MTELTPSLQEAVENGFNPTFAGKPFVLGPSLSKRRVAVVTSGGLSRRGEPLFRLGDSSYRAIPADTPAGELLMSHVSINFDRTGFMRDQNVLFPVERLYEMVAEGTIGSVAATHYSFMGAGYPVPMEPYAREVAARMKTDDVDAVLLTPA